jgi:AcrR family transcriptional regulator
MYRFTATLEGMSPQPSNRGALLEGALVCLARMPVDQISARALANESGANLASIGYHFGSKDSLMTAAVVEGLDRWLERINERLASVDGTAQPAERFQQAAQAVDATRADHEAVARAFVVALARGLHDQEVSAHLVEGFLHTRPRVARLLGLGDDDTGTDAGGLVHALFTGLLVQSLLSEDLVIDGDRIMAALHRIAERLAPA